MTSKRSHTLPAAAAGAAAVLSIAIFLAVGQTGGTTPVDRLEGSVAAPDFPDGLQWLNTDRPLRLAELRGKIVLLDFWTYCCINCMHVIPDLKKLEAKYPDTLVVIGVHSAKFTGEQDTENIRQAILRYGLEHPVVNDSRMRVWRQFGARAWPSFVLIDPAGKVVGRTSGEGIYEPMDSLVGEMVKHWDAKGALSHKPLKFALEKDKVPPALLAFPGKVLADEAGKRLFIADSNHNRIVVVSLKDGSILSVIGSGRMGLDDGDFATATFNHPQGMALVAETLYVADTENHAIRQVDLAKKTVATVAGTGEQARQFNVAGPGATTPLSSPWDVLAAGDTLYIAMAGSHQIWQMSLDKGHYAKPFAGSGREDRIDGPRLSAALAQTSGLATDGKLLYFADSETSSIRSVELAGDGGVRTIVGVALFEFGDRDGAADVVRLQHPLGVACHDGVLYVADTYNNRIKRLDPATGRCGAWLGSGRAGMADGVGAEATFDEPGGVSVAGGKLYIADTNNHLVRVADLKTARVETLRLREPAKLLPAAAEEGPPPVALPAQTVAPGEGTVRVSVELPEQCELTPGAPSSVKLASGDAKLLAFGGKAGTAVQAEQFPVSIPFTAAAGSGELTASVVVYYCEHKNAGLCFFHEASYRVPLKVDAAASGHEVSVKLTVQRGQ